MLEKLKQTTEFIKNKIHQAPEVGIVLGTGLGKLVNEIKDQQYIYYEDIPNFPVSTVLGHEGRLIFGTLGGKFIVAMQGRFHYYEGWSFQEITFPIRVMKYLGIEYLFLSNASGGVNFDYEIGDIMIVTDHINLMSGNPLIGFNEDQLGPRFPDMSEVYDQILISKAIEIARKNNIKFRTGVYAAVTGPTYETPSEYNYIRTIGADAVGMSTVPEAIVAKHMNLSCFAASVITDLGVIGKIVEISHHDVIDAASIVEPQFTLMIKELVASI
ncbi:purine-nucleoside phosphorylase [Bacteroidota bacterium]